MMHPVACSCSSITLTIISIISLTWIQVPILVSGNNKLVPSPYDCLSDGYFCFEVSGGADRYSYKVDPNDPDVLFSLSAARSRQCGEYCSHTWNMSMSDIIDEASVFLRFQQQHESQPYLSIGVRKLESVNMVMVNFYERIDDPADIRGYHWQELDGNKVWSMFSDLVMEGHSCQFTTRQLMDQKLGLESRNLTIHFLMEITKINGQPHQQKIDFTTSDGARYLFGDKTALREHYDQLEARRTTTTSTTTTTSASTITQETAVTAVEDETTTPVREVTDGGSKIDHGHVSQEPQAVKPADQADDGGRHKMHEPSGHREEGTRGRPAFPIIVVSLFAAGILLLAVIILAFYKYKNSSPSTR